MKINYRNNDESRIYFGNDKNNHTVTQSDIDNQRCHKYGFRIMDIQFPDLVLIFIGNQFAYHLKLLAEERKKQTIA